VHRASADNRERRDGNGNAGEHVDQITAADRHRRNDERDLENKAAERVQRDSAAKAWPNSTAAAG